MHPFIAQQEKKRNGKRKKEIKGTTAVHCAREQGLRDRRGEPCERMHFAIAGKHESGAAR